MSVREIVAAVAAVLVAAYLARRWRRLSFERKALAIVLLLGLAIYASGVLSALPDPKQIIESCGPARCSATPRASTSGAASAAASSRSTARA
jgi:hypothetical protein